MNWSDLTCQCQSIIDHLSIDLLWFQRQDSGVVASQDHEFSKLLKTIQGALLPHVVFIGVICRDSHPLVKVCCDLCVFLLISSHHAGIPPLADHAQLELTVAFNACVGSFAHSQFSEAELCVKHAVQRGRKCSAVFKAFLSSACISLPSIALVLVFLICPLSPCLQSCRIQLKNPPSIQKTSLRFGEQPSGQWRTHLWGLHCSVCLVCSGQCGWPLARWEPSRSFRWSLVSSYKLFDSLNEHLSHGHWLIS